MKNITLICTLCAISIITNGQIVNNSQFYVAKNALVSFADDMVNNGEIANNGSLVIQNNLTNNSKFISKGKLIVDGNGSQDFNGIQAIESANVEVNNDLNLKTSLLIGDKLSFGKGVVNTYLGAVVQFSGNGIYSGASDASHINGTVRKNDATSFEFPLGDGVSYKAFSVNGDKSNLEAKYVASNPTNISAALENDISEINQTEYWVLKSDGKSKIELKNKELVILKNDIWAKNNKDNLSSETYFTTGKSKIIAKEIGIWPNPSKGEFNLKLTGMKDADEVVIDISNEMGISVMNMKGKVQDFRKTYSIPTGLGASALTVKVISDNDALTQKLIIIR